MMGVMKLKSERIASHDAVVWVDVNSLVAAEVKGVRPVLAMGVFDGVHLGHQSLLKEAAVLGEQARAPLWVLTFWPHPDLVVGRWRREDGYLLTSLEDRMELLQQAGAERVIVLRFTPETASCSPESFASDLVSRLQPCAVAMGFNFTFGRGGQGGPATLQRLGREAGFRVIVHPAACLGGEVVSSSAVRAALGSGDVERASALLGRPYSLRGAVERGAGRGRELGFPTANVMLPQETVKPAPGVYVSSVLTGEATSALPASSGLPAVANLGMCPTFCGKDGGDGRLAEPRLEVHVMQGCPPTYGDVVRVFFHRRLRPEKKFGGPEALSNQIAVDRREAMDFFGLGDPVETSRPPKET